MPEIFTIGHSTHSQEKFLELLRQHRIEVVVDVRSSPYSARMPQFSREALEVFLKQQGIKYLFLGKELGARRTETECYVNGTATYDRIARLAAFQGGVQRVLKGAGDYRVSLMCAEKDPLTCHRTILVCRDLAGKGATVKHILDDGRVESHTEAEARLMKEEKVPEIDLFESPVDLLNRAYKRRGEKIAFTETEE